MKVRGVVIGLSPLHLIVVAFFIGLFVVSYLTTKDTAYLIWGIPLSLVLLVIPIANSYSVSSQYVKLLPEYEEQSNSVRVKQISVAMNGKPVRVEGVVQAVKGTWLCRPALTVFDGSGAIVAQRSAPLDERIVVGDNVEVVGMVVRRYTIMGNLVIHAIGVKKTDNVSPLDMDEPAEKIHIKKYQ